MRTATRIKNGLAIAVVAMGILGLTAGNFQAADVVSTFNGIMQWVFDLPDGAIIHNVYASWLHQGNSGSGHTYSYDEGTLTTFTRPAASSVGNLVLKWTASDNSSEDAYFQRIFEGPITVAGGDGFAVKFTASGNGAAYVDAVVLDVTLPGGLTGYALWKSTNAPTTGSNPNADEDGDGVTNGVEYVLGGTIGTNDIGLLPKSSLDGTDVLFTFVRDQASIDGTTTVQIEVSTDLANWNAGSSPYAVPDGAASNNPGVSVVKGSPTGFDTVTLRLPRAPDTAKFARLQVSFP